MVTEYDRQATKSAATATTLHLNSLIPVTSPFLLYTATGQPAAVNSFISLSNMIRKTRLVMHGYSFILKSVSVVQSTFVDPVLYEGQIAHAQWCAIQGHLGEAWWIIHRQTLEQVAFGGIARHQKQSNEWI
jgi:hypothetical protein